MRDGFRATFLWSELVKLDSLSAAHKLQQHSSIVSHEDHAATPTFDADHDYPCRSTFWLSRRAIPKHARAPCIIILKSHVRTPQHSSITCAGYHLLHLCMSTAPSSAARRIETPTKLMHAPQLQWLIQKLVTTGTCTSHNLLLITLRSNQTVPWFSSRNNVGH